MSSPDGHPRIHVGPEPDEHVSPAVERGGGVIASPEEAEAIVWLGKPDGLAPLLHDGVRWVQLPSAGIESWVKAGVLDEERLWTSAAGAYAHQVAEHGLALILAGFRRLPECARAEEWGDRFGRVLAGSTVVIVGAGGIGRALIEMLAPFRVRIVAVTRSGRDVAGADVCLAASDIARIWPEADVTFVAAPATDATRHLVGERELRAMPQDAWVVNVARGALIDTDALVRALAAGEIGGAALDVTDPEPLPDGHPLWSEPRALITPHTANPPSAMMITLAHRVEENVRRFAAGEEPMGKIDLQASY